MVFTRLPFNLNFRLNQLLHILIDAALISGAVYIGYYLRFDGAVPAHYIDTYVHTVFFYAGAHILAMALLRTYNNLWTYAVTKDYAKLAAASVLGSVTAVLITFFLGQPYPRSVYIMSWILIGVTTVVYRLLYRLKRDGSRSFSDSFPLRSKKTLFYGAGNAGAMVARELQKNRTSLDFYPLGFIDDDPSKWGLRICGLKVHGGKKVLYNMINSGGVDEVTIAMPSVSPEVLRDITAVCRSSGVPVQILPSLHELLNEGLNLGRLRNIRIEDLLGREPVHTEMGNISAYLSGRAVLVTGAGGTIGSELCRQVAGQKPSLLVIFDHDENAVYEIQREIEKMYPSLDIYPVVADMRNPSRVEKTFSQFSPEVVFHAAAHKHVPLMELNPEEAVENNIFGTRILADAAHSHGCSRFVLISTDKAVNPAGVMGATKRVAEMIIQDRACRSATKYCAVRFGNVLDSSGSVLPLFREQIAAGGPVTVTHRDMTRYFMTISEAVELVLQAGAMGKNGDIFLLDMGEPIRIIELAEETIRLSGLEPYRDIDILITSPRPGEKIFEELYHDEAQLKETDHKRIYLTVNTSRGVEEPDEEMHRLSDILKIDSGFIAREIGRTGKEAGAGEK